MTDSIHIRLEEATISREEPCQNGELGSEGG